MTKRSASEIWNAFLILVWTVPLLAFALWGFEPGDTSRVCGRNGCSSGAAIGLFAVLVGIGGVFAGLLTLWLALFPRNEHAYKRKLGPKTAYGSVEEYEQHLRKIGVAEHQIRAEMDKYRG